MARIRTIKPDFWTDEKIVELSAYARLLFIGLWNFADDEGRMPYSEKRIKMQIFPSDTLNISELFGELRREKLVEVYEAENSQYLQIVGFTKHQKVDKRLPSKLPAQTPQNTNSPRITPTEGKGREKEEEGKKKVSYRFAATIIKLSEKDYLELKKNYSAIPDFDAELLAADNQYSKEPPGNWFCALGNRLNAKHQLYTSKKPPTKADPNFRAGAAQA
jgi:hypothetical protein